MLTLSLASALAVSSDQQQASGSALTAAQTELAVRGNDAACLHDRPGCVKGLSMHNVPNCSSCGGDWCKTATGGDRAGQRDCIMFAFDDPKLINVSNFYFVNGTNAPAHIKGPNVGDGPGEVDCKSLVGTKTYCLDEAVFASTAAEQGWRENIFAALELTQECHSGAGIQGDFPFEACQDWCSDYGHCKYCKCRGCSKLRCNEPHAKETGRPEAPSNATVCHSPHKDDFTFETCQDWCTKPEYCSYCKCKSCPKLRCGEKHETEKPERVAPPNATACKSTIGDDFAWEDCQDWCSSYEHCRYCKCRGCSKLTCNEKHEKEKPIPVAPPGAKACKSPIGDDFAWEACQDWCSKPEYCRYCKCRGCSALRCEDAKPDEDEFLQALVRGQGGGAASTGWTLHEVAATAP